MIHVLPETIQIVRELDSIERAAKQPRDIVETLKESARSNRIFAVAIIASIVISAILVPIAAILTIIEKIINLQK
jgi:hypothetical protein